MNIVNSTLQWVYTKIVPDINRNATILGIQLDITNACNLTCDHCYHVHHKNHGALTFDRWVSVLDQYESLLKKLHMLPQITLCGGEPLLCLFLFSLVENIRKRFSNCTINLLSNGTVITPKIAEQLKKYAIHVQISLDGPDSLRHDSIRGKGSFDKALEGCLILKTHYVSFHHQAVLSKRTAPWISDFFKLPSVTGAREMDFTRLIVEGHAKKLGILGEDYPLEGLELKRALQNILYYSKTTKIPTKTSGPLWYLIDSTLGSPSNFGFGMVIGYRGEFKVSSRISMSLGNVLEEGLEKLFLKHHVMKRLRRGKIEGCGPCVYFRQCRGNRNASYAAYGHLFGPDPGCWVLNKNDNQLMEIQ